MLPGQVAKQPYFTFISKLRNKSSIATFGLGLYTGFIIRDEIAFPTFQTVDQIVTEYESKEALLLTQRQEVLQKISQLEAAKKNPRKSGTGGQKTQKSAKPP